MQSAFALPDRWRSGFAVGALAGLVAAGAAAPACAQEAPAAPAAAGGQDEPVPAARAPAAPRTAPASFMISAIDVSGVTLLSNAEIETIIYPFLGPDRGNQDVIAAQKALEKAYADKGYEAVQVEIPVQPNETFSRGIVQLAVREAPLGRVQVVDSRYHSPAAVRASIPSLVEGKPINVAELQRDVAEANRFPDRSIAPRFRAGAEPGTVDIDLAVQDKLPLHASLELNNDQSPNTRALRLSGSIRYSNLWGLGHTLSITGAMTPQDIDQSGVVSASYNAPLIGTPWTLVLYGYTSNSNVAALGGTNVLGNGYQIGARAVYRLPGDTVFKQISFGLDFKNFKENISLKGVALQPTRIRYLPLVAEYAMNETGEKSSFGLTFSTTAGLRVIKHDDCFESPYDTAEPPSGVATCKLGDGTTGVLADQFTGRAINASENFVHFNLDANYTRTLFADSQLALRFAGQWANSSLVTNEQFSLGGMSSVRGYYVSEGVGDDGFLGSIEARTPSMATWVGRFVDELRLFAFADGGYTRVRVPAAGQTSDYRFLSAGGGVRLQLFGALSGEFLVGVPLRAGAISRRGDPRYGFSLKGEF